MNDKTRPQPDPRGTQNAPLATPDGLTVASSHAASPHSVPPNPASNREEVLQRLALDLIGVDNASGLFAALERAFVALFEPLFCVASFAFSAEGPMTVWRSAPAPEHSPEWWARNQMLHPGIEWLRHNVGVQVVRVSDVLPDGQLEAHPYYREFMQPEGWHYSIGMFLWQQGRPVGMVAANRAREFGDYDAQDVESMRRVRAMIEPVYQRLAHGSCVDQRTQLFEAFLHEFPVPMFVFRPSTGQVDFANQTSRRALARWRGEEHLKPARTLKAEHVPSELREACMHLASARVVNHDSLPLRARLQPISAAHSLFSTDLVLVSIEERDVQVAPSPGWLSAMQALGPREQDVVRLAVAGHSNAEIAKRLGKSSATVKTQLEASYKKLRIAGRSDLVALFYGGVGVRAARGATRR